MVDMVPGAAPIAPQEPVPTKRSLKPLLAGGVTLLVLLGLIIVLGMKYGGFFFADSATRSLIITEPDGTLLSVGRFGLSAVGIASFSEFGTVVEYRESNGVSAALVRPEGIIGAVEVYVEDAQGKRLLPTNMGEKRSLALSPDGTRVAYATTEQDFTGFHSSNTSDWSIETVSLGSGEVTTLGAGYAPNFLSDTVLAYSAPDGLATADIVSGARSSEPSLAARTIEGSAAVSREYVVAWNGDVGAYFFLRVESAIPLRLALVRTVPSITLASPVIRDGYVYFLEPSQNKDSLVRYRLEEGERDAETLFSFPGVARDEDTLVRRAIR